MTEVSSDEYGEWRLTSTRPTWQELAKRMEQKQESPHIAPKGPKLTTKLKDGVGQL